MTKTMTIKPFGLREYIREFKHRFSDRRVCGMGSGYPKQSTHNCRETAVVRTRIAERFDWHYYCEFHSKWPAKDRSRWKDYDGIQQLVDGEWVDWNDWRIHAPESKQHIPDPYDSRVEFLSAVELQEDG